MPRQAATYFDFKGGLNTESSPLNTPSTDATAIDNIQLNIDGSLQRRRGFDFLGASDLGEYYKTTTTDYTEATGTYVYDAMGMGVANLVDPITGKLRRFLILHVGSELKIYDYSIQTSLYGGGVALFTYQLLGYDARQNHYRTKIITDNRTVFIINPYLDLLRLEYTGNDVFNVVVSKVRVRDLDAQTPVVDSYVNHNGSNYKAIRGHTPTSDNEPGVGDIWKDFWVFNGPTDSNYGAWTSSEIASSRVNHTSRLDIDPELGTFQSVTRLYACVKTHTSSASNEPDYYNSSSSTWKTYWKDIGPWDKTYPNWQSGLVYSADPLIVTEDIYTSNIIDAEATSDDQLGWYNGTFSSGRLWLIGLKGKETTVFYSQSIQEGNEYTRMYQFADPYNEFDSQQVATDGGSLTITGAESLVNIVAFENGVLVFATNGVWYISGQDGFDPTNFIINKVSENRLLGPDGVTYAEDTVIFLSDSGMYVIKPTDALSTLPKLTSLTEKINTLYTNIPIDARNAMKVVYNSKNKKLYIGYVDTVYDWYLSGSPVNSPGLYRNLLIYDIRLQAWYKHSLPMDTMGTKVYINDFIMLDYRKADEEQVVDSSLELVTDISGEVVVADSSVQGNESLNVIYIFAKRNGNNLDYAFGTDDGGSFTDFSLVAADAEDYESSIEFAYQVFNDVLKQKQMPYIVTIFKRVESGELTPEGLDNTPGSCFMRIDWDWATNNKSKKFGSERQVYFPHRYTTSFYGGVSTGSDLVVSKHKIRGRGDVARFTFTSESGKDFVLYGWEALYHVNSRS